MFQLYIVSLLVTRVYSSTLHEGRRQTIERVRKYLTDIKTWTLPNIGWLENSNKIGFGYNLLAASPVCYTGACQMDEFTRSIFKLNYTAPPVGSCTNKLVPNNVELDCLPSTVQAVDSEIIDTVEHLHKSISKKIDVSVEVKFRGVGFSYGFSRETKNMIDNIVKNHQTSIVSLSFFSHHFET